VCTFDTPRGCTVVTPATNRTIDPPTCFDSGEPIDPTKVTIDPAILPELRVEMEQALEQIQARLKDIDQAERQLKERGEG
jgi:hypothetical protein